MNYEFEVTTLWLVFLAGFFQAWFKIWQKYICEKTEIQKLKISKTRIKVQNYKVNNNDITQKINNDAQYLFGGESAKINQDVWKSNDSATLLINLFVTILPFTISIQFTLCMNSTIWKSSQEHYFPNRKKG